MNAASRTGSSSRQRHSPPPRRAKIASRVSVAAARATSYRASSGRWSAGSSPIRRSASYRFPDSPPSRWVRADCSVTVRVIPPYENYRACRAVGRGGAGRVRLPEGRNSLLPNAEPAGDGEPVRPNPIAVPFAVAAAVPAASTEHIAGLFLGTAERNLPCPPALGMRRHAAVPCHGASEPGYPARSRLDLGSVRLFRSQPMRHRVRVAVAGARAWDQTNLAIVAT